MTTGGNTQPLCKLSGEWRTQGKGPHTDVEVRVAYGLFHTVTLAKLLDGVDVHELRISAVRSGWRLMLKGTRGGEPLASYFYAGQWRDLITLMATSLDIGYTSWVRDPFPRRPPRRA